MASYLRRSLEEQIANLLLVGFLAQTRTATIKYKRFPNTSIFFSSVALLFTVYCSLFICVAD